MYVESVYVKIKGEEKTRDGYYIGITDNSEVSTILDISYKPIPAEDIEEVFSNSGDVQFRCTSAEDSKYYSKKYKTRKLDAFN